MKAPRSIRPLQPADLTGGRPPWIPRELPLYSTYVPTTDADHKVLLGIGLSPGGPPNRSYAYLVSEALYAEDDVVTVVRLSYTGAVDWRQSFDIGQGFAFGMAVDSNGNIYITGRDNNEGPNSQ